MLVLARRIDVSVPLSDTDIDQPQAQDNVNI